MPHPGLSAAVARAGSLAVPDADDGHLVTRFARSGDGAAFAELVRRLGPMVLGVCRRVAGDPHLADDAFQAAFLVLARRAADVRPAGAVRGWVYGVAVRVAREARAVSARRRAREVPVAAPPDRPAGVADPPDADALRALDEEVAALPEHLRAAVVMCELGGLTRRDAAPRLGVPEGTVSSRLAKARRLLADRLRRRGFAPPAAGLAAVALAAVPPALAASASALASPGAPVPPAVAALTTGVFRAMTASKLKATGFALAAAALLGAGAAYSAGLFAAPPADPPPPPKAAVPQPEANLPPAGPNRILFLRDGHLVLVDPDGKNETTVARERGAPRAVAARLSPDGKRVAVQVESPAAADPAPDAPPRYRVYVRDVGGKGPGTPLGGHVDGFAWSPDGAGVAYTTLHPGNDAAKRHAAHGLEDLAKKTDGPLLLSPDHMICDWSRDGKFFLTGGGATDRVWPSLWLTSRDGDELRRLTHPAVACTGGRLSPDGKRLLYGGFVPQNVPAAKDAPGEVGKFELRVLDVASRKSAAVANVPDGGEPTGLCWSPDGKRVAYGWCEGPAFDGDGKPVVDQEREARLVVCDPDGKNAKAVATWKVKPPPGQPGRVEVDWR
jgi:RNA polymerase sigma factor (sigma-70 family)